MSTLEKEADKNNIMILSVLEGRDKIKQFI